MTVGPSGKTALTEEIDSYRARRGVFVVLTVPPMRYLMVDGHGDPNTARAYQEAVSTIYPVAYTLKFASRRELGHDYVVPPLEGLWWSDDMDTFTDSRDKSRWTWTLLSLVPQWLTDADVERARATVAGKGGAPALDRLRVQSLDEGLCVQTLHVGPYDDEGPVLRAMHDEFIPGEGLALTGTHHEIYLGDPRRARPDRLRTILRQPVTRHTIGTRAHS
ncbi:GyrI-like domain-containing protein [Williamsia sterculiae]|uniref:GyrI-like small molecule binding domain-containing protein n=1 Tax=Williamsia sterculiae TaxID=1344003 RepID=A0A1N7FL75_9NOCA|nr:GyrI-like domain-containing protein [Williamsia sterculiae]SIS01040.1 hypothetical protein SAMN05445060_2163 [Williamsia sterculiae]